MIGIVIAIGVLLITAILLLVFRVQSLVGVIKGSDKKPGAGMNKTNAVLMMLFMIIGLLFAAWYSIAYFDEYTLPIASEHGVTTDRLFWITMAITGVVFVITQILLFYFSYKYQYKKNSSALFFPDNNKLEMLWTVVPAVALTFLVLYGLIVWNRIMAPAPYNAEVIEIMGYQFAWKTRYPGPDGELGNYNYQLIDVDNLFGMDMTDDASFDDFVPRELHLPKGRPVEFRIRARDVLHSVFAPHFRLKMDAVPGMPTRFTFTPTKTTEEMRLETGNPDFNYEIACTEICGRGHFSMRLMVIVHEAAEYDEWKAEQKSWLSRNPDFLGKVPDKLKEKAKEKSGIEMELASQDQ